MKPHPFCCTIHLPLSTIAVASCPFFDLPKNIKRFLLIAFAEISASKQCTAGFELSSLSINSFLGCAVEAETAFSRKTLEAPEARMRGRKKRNFTSTFALTAPPVLRATGTRQVCQILRASTALQSYAASDMLVAQWFFRLFRGKTCRLLF